MKTLIFADVHLKVSPEQEHVQAAFATFVRRIDPATYDTVVILGDLFDFWFEYKHVVFSGYFEVLRAFADLREKGVHIHLVCGNHDFWAGKFLSQRLGFHIHTQPYTCELGGKRVLFVHGDGVNPEDRSYRLYKWFARSRLVVWLFGTLIHPDFAMALAQRVAHGSRAMFTTEDPSQGREVEPLRRYAQSVLEAGQADVVICGHSHYPVEETFETPAGTGLYINTGDWIEHRTYVDWDGAEFQARRYDDEAGFAE